MHLSFGHALVVSALVASVVLLLHREDRLFPALAVLASGLEALIVFNVIELMSGKLRTDVILPGVLAAAGAVCWGRSDSKPSTTAATVLLLVGALQLLLALGVMH